MQRLKVTLQPTPNHYKLIDENGNHIKTTSVMYVAELIEKYGLFFLLDVRKEISKRELCLLAEHHYKEQATILLTDAKQKEMLAGLQSATATFRKISYTHEGLSMNDRWYSVIFSNRLEINVSEYHWRMFSSLPLSKNQTLTIKQEKLFV